MSSKYKELSKTEKANVTQNFKRGTQQEKGEAQINGILILAWIHCFIALITLCAVEASYVWTSPNLPLADVPFYDHSWAPWKSDRWNFLHIMIVLLIPIYFVPVIILLTITSKPFNAGLYALQFIASIFFCILDYGLLIMWIIFWARCSFYAVCRNEDILVNPSTPTIYFYFLFFGHLCLTITSSVIPLLAWFTRHTMRSLMWEADFKGR
jgi:hypothetical protein